MSLPCEVTPVSAFLSTNLNNKIQCYERLGDRIKRSLGYPLITIEIHQDQLFENIQIAIEFFTKFAGYTTEYLIFDSNLYEKNKGVRLDHLFTISNSNLTTEQKLLDAPKFPGPNFNVKTPQEVYITTTPVLSDVFASSETLSSTFTNGITELEIIDQDIFNTITTFDPSLSANFKKTVQKTMTIACEDTSATQFSNVFDYDALDYRKVIEVIDFEEGSTTGINTLFTLEQTLAQQTYFSYALGNYGFDLLSWYTVKEFMDTREKLLATKRDTKFDSRTQYLQMYPQPNKNRFYGVISCYVERPIRDIIKEQWVYQYALALSKITVGRVRGRFGNVNLLGGGSLNYQDILQEGISDKAELEKRLLEGASAGFGDSDPVLFFVG
jgi:hypothetical protein